MLFKNKRLLIIGGTFLIVLIIAAALFKKLTRPAAESQLSCSFTKTQSKHDGMVWVTPGELTMGDTLYPEEKPFTSHHVEGFWISQTEVTNREFAEFVSATGYVTVAEKGLSAREYPELPEYMRQAGGLVFHSPTQKSPSDDVSDWWQYIPAANWRHPTGPESSIEGKEDYPVTQVTLEDALAYAQWKGHSIPTEMEWEWAARNAQPSANTHQQPTNANTWQGLFPYKNDGTDGHIGLAPVGCYEASPLGAHDLMGNVWEITQTGFSDTLLNTPRRMDQQYLNQHRSNALVTIKGGSYLCAPNYCLRYRPAARQGQEVTLATSHIGFRTILHAPPPRTQ